MTCPRLPTTPEVIRNLHWRVVMTAMRAVEAKSGTKRRRYLEGVLSRSITRFDHALDRGVLGKSTVRRLSKGTRK